MAKPDGAASQSQRDPLTGTAQSAIKACTLQLEISGVVGPSTLDYLNRGLELANHQGCSSALILMNTPGGNLVSTRKIVESIVNSKIPILCLVAPSGGHAGSAGAIILLSCHVAGALKATNIGAATPILGTGQELSKDLRQKMINDTVSWVEGLARLRGRSSEFAKAIVEKAKAVDSYQAKKINAIDAVVSTVEEFLIFSQGRVVKLGDSSEAKVAVGPVRVFDQDFRYRLLELITDPEFAYIMFMGSLALIYFELTHPGAIAPGVIGTLGIVVSLIAFHKLEVWWGGLVLIILGLIFLIAEAFVPSFGALGIGGLVSFVVGSIFLFDSQSTGYQLPLPTILATALTSGIIMLGIAYLALKTRKVKKSSGFDALIGKPARVLSLKDGSDRQGMLECQGEIWKFSASRPVQVDQVVEVVNHDGFTLLV